MTLNSALSESKTAQLERVHAMATHAVGHWVVSVRDQEALHAVLADRDALLKAVKDSFEYLDETLGCDNCKDDPDCGCILHDLHAAVAQAHGRKEQTS